MHFAWGAPCPPSALYDVEAMRSPGDGGVLNEIRQAAESGEDSEVDRIWRSEILPGRNISMDAAIIYHMVRNNGLIYDKDVFLSLSKEANLEQWREDELRPHIYASRVMAQRKGVGFYETWPDVYGTLYFFKMIENERMAPYINRYLDYLSGYMKEDFLSKWEDDFGIYSDKIKDFKGWAEMGAKKLAECNGVDVR